MYIVAVTYTGNPEADLPQEEYFILEDLQTARAKYLELLKDENTYSAQIADIVESTDPQHMEEEPETRWVIVNPDFDDHGKIFYHSDDLIAHMRRHGDEVYNEPGDDFLYDEAWQHGHFRIERLINGVWEEDN